MGYKTITIRGKLFLSLISACFSQLPGGVMDQGDMFSAMNYWVQINSVMGLISIHNAKSWQQLYDLYHGSNSKDATFMLGRSCNIITEPCTAVNSVCNNGACGCMLPNQNFLDIFCLDTKVVKLLEEKTGLGSANITRKGPVTTPTSFPTLTNTGAGLTSSTFMNNFSMSSLPRDFSHLVTPTPIPAPAITFPTLNSQNSQNFPTTSNTYDMTHKDDPFMATAERFTGLQNIPYEMTTYRPKVETISIEEIDDQITTEPPKIIKRIRGPRRKGPGLGRLSKGTLQQPEEQNEQPFY